MDFTQFIDRSLDLYCVIDRKGRFQWLSPRWPETFGWTNDEIRSQPFIELIHSDDFSTLSKALKQAQNGEKVVRFEVRFRTKADDYVWLEWSAAPCNDEHIYASVRDVTEAKRLEDRLAEERRLFGFAQQLARVGYWNVDLATYELAWSSGVFNIRDVMLTEATPIAEPDEDVYIPENPRFIKGSLDNALHTGKSVDSLVRLVKDDGYFRVVRLQGRVERDDDDRAVAISGAFQDVTKYHQAQQSIQQSRDFLESVLDNIAQGVAVYDDQLRLVNWNTRFLDIHRLQPADIKAGMGLADIVRLFALRGDYGDSNVDQIVRDRMARIRDPRQIEEHFYDRKITNDEVVEVRGKPMPGGGMVTTYTDITKRKQAISKAQHLAYHDPLTSLPNRAKFWERLEKACKHSDRNLSTVALLLLDLDHFKEINDTLGHPIGDRLLKATSDRLVETTRDTDTVARLGGDEFAIVATGILEQDGHVDLAKRVLKRVCEAYHFDEHELNVGTSIGIALHKPGDGIDAHQLVSNADYALYEAKSAGRQTYSVFDESMKQFVRKRRGLEEDLKTAIDNNELVLHFQPQIDLKTREVVGCEALLRWRHPERGNISPDIFIPIAERLRLIDPLTELVLKQACDQVKKVEELGFKDLKIAVNVSAMSLRSRAIVDLINRVLEEKSVRPNRIEVEVTESALLDLDKALPVLEEIRSNGIHIAIDDFGTGYSSFSRICDLPIDKLKIDRSFVNVSLEETRHAAVVHSIVDLGRRLGITVVAEGIEEDWQMELLTQMGCPFGQGFLFAKPVSADEMNGYLVRTTRRDAAPEAASVKERKLEAV